jgi:hypothetical protein
MALHPHLCLLLAAQPLAARAPPPAPVPAPEAKAAPAPAQPDINKLRERYPLADTAYLRWEANFDEDAPGFFKPVKEHTESVFRQSLVLRANRNTPRTFAPLLMSGSTLTEASVTWTLPDGKTGTAGLDKFTNKIVGVENRRSFTFPALPEGTMVEERYTAKVPGVVRGFLIPLSYDACYLAGHVEFILPKGSSFKLKNPLAESGRGQVAYSEHPSGRGLWTLDFKEFGPEEPSPLSPSTLPPAAIVWERVFYPTYLLTPGQSVGGFYHKVASRKPWFSTAVEDTVARLLQGKETKRAKVQAIYDFLQQEIKVIKKGDDTGSGIFGNSPLDFADMLEQKKGSSDGIPALMNQMLSKVGIDSKLVLIQRSLTGEFDPKYLDPRDHYDVAVWLDLDGVTTLAQPQYTGRPLGQISSIHMNRPAIVVRDESELEVLRSPAFLPLENRYEDTWTLEVSERGTGKIHFERAATGPEAQEFLEIWKAQPEWKKTDRKVLFDLIPASPFGNPTAASVKEGEGPDKPLRFSLDLDLPIICRAKDGAIQLNPLAAAFMFSPYHRAPAKDTSRQAPVWVPYNQITKRTLLIKVPAGWKLQSPLPDPQQVHNLLGTAEAKFSLEGDVIRVDQSLSLVPGLHAPVYGEALLHLAGEKSPLVIPAFRFVPSSPAPKQ